MYKLPPVAAMFYVAPLFGCAVPNMAQYCVVTNALKDVSLEAALVCQDKHCSTLKFGYYVR